MALPTEPGLYADADDELWLLRDDGMWQQVGRQLPFGGVQLDPSAEPLPPSALGHGTAPHPSRRVEIPPDVLS
ncbi:hypothetical protein [Nocardia vulneris]|uniref:Uncharacterized protein n=1 Tax=Nocardia vulneris TaxID=1141657 RepID=A0ABR4ZCL6_9NOCA|nr:hypothetical protein [Nocardia vulneris]KIA62983.1 hypothetical protein FG87_21600 [Nocardia vulneris]